MPGGNMFKGQGPGAGGAQHLLAPSFQPPIGIPIPGFPVANSQLVDSASLPATVTFSNSYTTALGDCILISYCVAGSTTPTFSGAGATWTTFNAQTAPVAGLVVGYNCSSGQTSIGVAGINGLQGTFAVVIMQGIKASSNPVTSTQVGTQAAGTTVTTASLSYSFGQVVVAGGGWSSGGATWVSAVWSNGATNIHTIAGGTNRPVSFDSFIPSASGSTTLTETFSSSSTAGFTIAALTHA